MPLSRKSLSLALFFVPLAASAVAGVPDPTRSTICTFVKVVGYAVNGTPDADGVCCVTLKDFAGNPAVNKRIEVDFSECCDINLCSATANLVSCSPPIIAGKTDDQGRFCFTAIGAAKDNGIYVQPNATAGAGLGCVEYRADLPVLQSSAGAAAASSPAGTLPVLGRGTAVAYDQDGALGSGGAGVNTLDVSIIRSLIIANLLTSFAQYRGRGDLDGNGRIDFLDLSFMLKQVTRANLDTGVANGASSKNGCPGGYCTAKVPGPNCP